MIDAIKRGDELAFELAYEKFRGKVYGYLLKKTRCPENARDLLQTTFLKLWKYRQSLSTVYPLEQQLFHISRTVFIDHLRKQNRINTLQSNAAEQPVHSYISTDFDVRSQLETALSDMPEMRKRVFELNRIQGYSYQEIAEQLLISVKSVDNNLSKALKYLRKRVRFTSIFLFLM